ncbi:hypothetical protein [Paraburkholderia sp. UYCP14C]|nr:hypothetical protein [Paraburkholderia sp. UYCP14C]
MTQRAASDCLAGSHTYAAQVMRGAIALEAAMRGARDDEGAVATREDQF